MHYYKINILYVTHTRVYTGRIYYAVGQRSRVDISRVLYVKWVYILFRKYNDNNITYKNACVAAIDFQKFHAVHYKNYVGNFAAFRRYDHGN